jgi:hypothetical protein
LISLNCRRKNIHFVGFSSVTACVLKVRRNVHQQQSNQSLSTTPIKRMSPASGQEGILHITSVDSSESRYACKAKRRTEQRYCPVRDCNFPICRLDLFGVLFSESTTASAVMVDLMSTDMSTTGIPEENVVKASLNTFLDPLRVSCHRSYTTMRNNLVRKLQRLLLLRLQHCNHAR